MAEPVPETLPVPPQRRATRAVQRGGARRGVPTWKARITRSVATKPRPPFTPYVVRSAPSDVPAYVEWSPSGRLRPVIAGLYVGASTTGTVSLFHAVQSGSHPSWLVTWASLGVGLASWGYLALRAPTVVAIRDGVLEITHRTGTDQVDLGAPASSVDVGDHPHSPRWRAVVTLHDGRRVTLRRRHVDPHQFIALVARLRPDHRT